MFKSLLISVVVLLTPTAVLAQAAEDEELSLTAEEQELQARIEALTPEIGQISLRGAPVTLSVSDGYEYYDKQETRFILEDLWGNPPDDTVLGMVFPVSEQENWSVVFTYEKTGYVTDEDAASTDFDKILRDMQKQTRESNAYRRQQGYPGAELVGWAVAPRYDATVNGLFWAKDLIFDGEDEHTLNYDMRKLGRRGVLSMNFIAGLEDVEAIEQAAPTILTMAQFNDGARYADYQEGDAKAGYGVAALVAGTTGAAVAKKAGLFGIVALALKKFWFVAIAGIMGLFGIVKRMFGRSN